MASRLCDRWHPRPKSTENHENTGRAKGICSWLLPPLALCPHPPLSLGDAHMHIEMGPTATSVTWEVCRTAPGSTCQQKPPFLGIMVSGGPWVDSWWRPSRSGPEWWPPCGQPRWGLTFTIWQWPRVCKVTKHFGIKRLYSTIRWRDHNGWVFQII